jgi:predicted Fe-S protein YdhL (DUF1289 family)
MISNKRDVKEKEQATQIASPCVRQCCLDKNDICLGCFRTLSEIVSWSALDAAQKQDVIDKCSQRRGA